MIGTRLVGGVIVAAIALGLVFGGRALGLGEPAIAVTVVVFAVLVRLVWRGR